MGRARPPRQLGGRTRQPGIGTHDAARNTGVQKIEDVWHHPHDGLRLLDMVCQRGSNQRSSDTRSCGPN
eukprot:429144-Prymnesium_polylepis.1